MAALKELVNYSLEKKDAKTATEAQSLIVYITSLKFVLSVVIWYDLLFHISKTSKIMQTCGISLEIIELEIKATLAFLEKYCNDGDNTAIIEGREIAKNLDVDSTFAESSSSSFEGHPLQVRHKEDWGRGFILLLPQTAALPESDAGSDVIKPASSFVIQNRQTACSMWCPMYRTRC